MAGQHAVLQVDACLPDQVVTGDEVVVHDAHNQVLVQWQHRRHLKHPSHRGKHACRLSLNM